MSDWRDDFIAWCAEERDRALRQNDALNNGFKFTAIGPDGLEIDLKADSVAHNTRVIAEMDRLLLKIAEDRASGR